MSTYSLCRKIVDEQVLIDYVQRVPFFNDEPQFFTFSAILKNKDIPEDISGGGTSLNSKDAYIKAVMEALERYSLIPSEKEEEIWQKFLISDLEKKNNIDFRSYIKFSKKQLKQKKYKDFLYDKNTDSLNCCLVEDVLNKTKCYMPAQFFYLPYFEDEKILRLPISTGAASGLSKEDCIYRGILEIVERDQFINSYLGKIPGERVNMLNPSSSIKSILEELNFYNLIPHIILLESDIKIPTILTILEDPTGIGPLYTLGLKSSFNISNCIKGSLEEAFHSRRWLRYESEMKGKKYLENVLKNKNEVVDILDRGLIWASQEVRGELDFWIKNGNEKNINFNKELHKEVSLEDLLTIIKKLGWSCYTKDFSQKELNRYGVYTFKTFIPEAHPLYLDERFPYLDDTRLKIILNTDEDIETNYFLQPFL